MNNRQIDLFDPRHVEFTTTLNKILLQHSPRVVANICVSLIDEDLLYDVQQMGTINPWALLTTLIYTNSKYFNLKTVEAHQTTSFANFGKYSQWVRVSSSAPQGQQMNYLRFFAHNPGGKDRFAPISSIFHLQISNRWPTHRRSTKSPNRRTIPFVVRSNNTIFTFRNGKTSRTRDSGASRDEFASSSPSQSRTSSRHSGCFLPSSTRRSNGRKFDLVFE